MAQQGYITHSIQVGDSIQRLAIMYQIDDWRSIVYLNNLEYPYIDSEIGSTTYQDNPNVLKVGNSVLIPSTYFSPILAQSDMSDLEKRAYGCDLDIYYFDDSSELGVRLEERGELSSQNGDLKIAEGIRNLRQRLIIRLSLNKGSLILHPEFGSELSKLIGLKSTIQTLIKMKLEVQRCILSDPLIKGVSNIVVTKLDEGNIMVECSIIPVPPYSPFKFSESLPVVST